MDLDISKVIIFSDMDGTLLTTDKRISDENMAAIREFTSLGGRFTIATGRTIQTFRQYVDMLELKSPVIMYNGAAIYDYSAGKILYSKPLPDISRGLTAAIVDYVEDCGGEVLRADGTYVFRNTKYEQIHTDLCRIEPYYAEIDDIPPGDWLKVLFALAPDKVALLDEKIRRKGLCAFADFVRSADIFLEMLPKGVSKGSALEEYRRLDGMDDCIFIAVGDYDNDIEMIKAADIGVCPANAERSVKEAADIVLKSTNDEHAIKEIIELIIHN